MIDWPHYCRLLKDATDKLLREFFLEEPLHTVSAIGYTFELWNIGPAFSLCANTHQYFRDHRRRVKKEFPKLDEDRIRWSSGDYKHCAMRLCDDRKTGWDAEYVRLHEIADADPESREIYEGLVKISCETLAALAREGLFGDWTNIDFNVAEYGDEIQTIKERDRMIRAMILGKKKRP